MHALFKLGWIASFTAFMIACGNESDSSDAPSDQTSGGGSGGTSTSTGGDAGTTSGVSGSGGAGTAGGENATGGTSGGGGSAGTAGAGLGGGSSGGAAGVSGSGGATTAGSGGSAAEDTWESFAQGFMQTYCWGCHNDDESGDATRDYHDKSVVVAESNEIACGVAPPELYADRGCSGFPPARQFPVGDGAKPSDAERIRFVEWIAAGMP